MEVMKLYPQCRLTVLCGHTHSPGTAQILPNLQTLTGRAEYGKLYIQHIFDIDGKFFHLQKGGVM